MCLNQFVPPISYTLGLVKDCPCVNGDVRDCRSLIPSTIVTNVEFSLHAIYGGSEQEPYHLTQEWIHSGRIVDEPQNSTNGVRSILVVVVRGFGSNSTTPLLVGVVRLQL